MHEIHDRPREEMPRRMAENYNHFGDGNFSSGKRRIDHFLATEVFRQASGMMSEVGSVQTAHDRASEEMPRCMAEN